MSSVIDPDQMPQNDTGSTHNLPLTYEFFDKLIGNNIQGKPVCLESVA